MEYQSQKANPKQIAQPTTTTRNKISLQENYANIFNRTETQNPLFTMKSALILRMRI